VTARLESGNVDVREVLNVEVSLRDRLLVSGSGTVTAHCRVAWPLIDDGATANRTIAMGRCGAD
jgi:hypothetical protein